MNEKLLYVLLELSQFYKSQLIYTQMKFSLSSPPPFPNNEMIGIFLDLAYLASLIKLIDCLFFIFPPDVENKKEHLLLKRMKKILLRHNHQN